MSPLLGGARSIAAGFLEAQGQAPLAAAVRAGGGDDFPEVKIAIAALRVHGRELQRLRAALANYAESDFWDASTPEAALAYYDHGAIARDALAGREQTHRD